MQEPLLVGDVGGTNVRFAVAVRRAGALRIERFEAMQGDNFASLEEALHQYLQQTGVRCRAACLAIAGPVLDARGKLTNRGWEISASSIAREFRLDQVLLINDFKAMARSVPELDAGAFEPIFEGVAQPGLPMVVAGPGTGFGVATLLRHRSGRWSVISGEGGHMAYAPRTDIEFELARILHRDHSYVSNELVASGSGLVAVHSAFCEIFGVEVEALTPAEMRARADSGDPMFKALIEVRALAVMGAVGDLALANGARGGVVLAGVVSERIADFLRTPAARERFVSRGPMSHYLAGCPVRLLHDPIAPLIGAAAHFEHEI